MTDTQAIRERAERLKRVLINYSNHSADEHDVLNIADEVGLTVVGDLLAALDREKVLEAEKSIPIDMILYCPGCGAEHIDQEEPERGWKNPPHKSHLCHSCGAIWRPCDVPTNGVQRIKTRGEKDTTYGLTAGWKLERLDADNEKLARLLNETESQLSTLRQHAEAMADDMERPELVDWACCTTLMDYRAAFPASAPKGK